MSMEDFFGQDSWYQEGTYWRKPNSDGSNGKGDLIYNTCGKIVYDGDTSAWAKEAIFRCNALLEARKRWPDYMRHYRDTANRFTRAVNKSWYKICRFLWKIHIIKDFTQRPHRVQSRMSRDPFIALFTVCTHLDDYDKINSLSMPLHIYSPSTWIWHKFLKTGKSFHLKAYRFWSRFSTSKKEYVSRLGQLREIAIENKLKKVAK